MATSASAVHSCFSTTTTRWHLISSDSVLKPAGARAVPLLPSFSHFTDYLSVTSVHQRRNPSKITAVVAQEEVDAEREGAQAEANTRLQNTKLYFGNLPYHCDSEQLASVIQEYGSPEMIELPQPNPYHLDTRTTTIHPQKQQKNGHSPHGLRSDAAPPTLAPNPPPLLLHLLPVGPPDPPNPASHPLFAGNFTRTVFFGESRGHPSVRPQEEAGEDRGEGGGGGEGRGEGSGGRDCGGGEGCGSGGGGGD